VSCFVHVIVLTCQFDDCYKLISRDVRVDFGNVNLLL